MGNLQGLKETNREAEEVKKKEAFLAFLLLLF
jgi:hypothetical protein